MGEIDHASSRALIESMARLVDSADGKTRTDGVVTRVESDGTVWVRVKGSTSETPCVRTTASAKPNDQVVVSISGGRATIEGNMTSPATDDAKADEAIKTGSAAKQAAESARKLADSAIGDAQVAKTAATSAAKDAASAASSAASASTSASSAASSAASAAGDASSASASAASAASSADSAASDAQSAMSSALSALTQLGTVEDVMGTLAWLRDHEVYMPATEFSEGETYFELVDGKYVQVENPVAGDVANYYVYDHQATMANFLQTHLTLTSKGLYITQTKPTEYKQGDDDFYCYVVATSFDPDETYYTRSFGTADNPVMNYVEVSNPTADGIGSYYVRKSNAGNIRPTGSGYMLLSGNDILIYGETGLPLARYGGDGIEFYDGKTNTVVASIKDQTLTINKAQLEGELAIEHWVWLQRGSGNISFKWRD